MVGTARIRIWHLATLAGSDEDGRKLMRSRKRKGKGQLYKKKKVKLKIVRYCYHLFLDSRK